MKRGKFLFTLILAVVVLAIAGCMLAACNDKDTYTVTFNVDGVNTFKVEVKKDTALTEPETLEKDGALFGGWFDENNNFWDFDAPVTQDMTLHAEWGNANLALDAGEGDKTEVYVKSGSAFKLPVPTASSDALTFAGWEASGAMITGADGKSTAKWGATSYVTANAVWTTKGDKDVFRANVKEDGTYSISAWGTEYSSEVTFPSEIGGKAVTEIGNMSKLGAHKVVVPASVKTIAARAFFQNASVAVVDLSAFGGAIGNYAFNGSEVGIVDLGGTTSIGEHAFSVSNVSLLYVPASVKNCADGALENDLLVEVDFEGDFPTLGKKVFGEGTSDLSIIASQKAWDKLIEGTDETKDFNVRVQEATGLAKGGVFTWDDELMASGIASHGFYEGEFEAYLGLGLNIAVVIDGKVELADVYDGKDANDHFYNLAETPTTTYYLDKTKKNIEKMTANDKGEVVVDDVLYNYVGSESVYTVSDGIKEIAGGAGITNSTVRFLHTGDVEKVGNFAFANAWLFGVTIGESVTEIGDYAFFNNHYLAQLIFEGTTAPTVGQGAFCDLVQEVLLVPMTYNTLASYGASVKIYTVDPITASWWDDEEPKGKPFFDAMVKSLEGLDMSEIKDSPDDEGEPATYETSGFSQLKTDYFAAKGKTYTSDYGTITMFGTQSGYALIDYNEASGFKGKGYLYFNAVPGYSLSYYDSDSAPLKFEMTYFSDGKAQSSIVYGQLSGDKLIPRGAEAGTYGDVDKDYFVLDGYSIIKCRKQDGQFLQGTYVNKDGKVTVTGIDGIKELTFDAENQTLTFDGDTLSSLGEEAGVYYDIINKAILKLDGKPTEEGYSGTMTLVYNGKTETMPYYINGKKLTFTLNGEDKEWEFSKTSDDVCTGYYGYYEYYLKFNEISVGLKDTFSKGNSKLTLDGFFGATLDKTDCTYYQFGTSILLFVGDDVTIYNLDLTAHTFAEPTAPEAGVYYITTSENYRVYIDGKGNLLYFTGDDYDLYTYTLGQDGTFETFTGEGEDKQGTTLKGKLNAEKGYGMFVYYSGGSDSFAAISKNPFEKILSDKYFSVYGVNNNKVQTKWLSLNAYLSNNVMFITTYDNAVGMYELDGQAQNFTYTFASSDGWTADIDVKVTKNASSYEVELSFKSGSSDHKTVTVDGSEKQLVFCWLNDEKTMVGIYEDDSWVSNFFCGTVKWTEDGKSFTVTDGTDTYNFSGYDTEKPTATKSEPPKSEEA